MGRLGCRMNNAGRSQFFDQIKHCLSVADVQLMMTKILQCPYQALLAPASVTRGAEENGPLIIVDAVDGKSLFVKEGSDFRADQPR